MWLIWTAFTLIASPQSVGKSPENPLYQAIIAEGLTANGETVKLPAPTLPDGLDAAASRAAIQAVAGDDKAVQELLRDSVTAPFVLKTRDVKAGDAIFRVVDLHFVVHARVDEFDADRVLGQAAESSIEVANMRFDSKILRREELQEAKIQPLPSVEGRKEWFTHGKGRLLDRIVVEATDRSVATRSEGSLVFASRTEPAFGTDSKFPNRWSSLTRKGAVETVNTPRPYPGSLSYVKVTPIPGEGEALFVESHLIFVEPVDWFQGNPILRSKLGVIAQDQIRRLRREIQQNRDKSKKRD